LFVVKSFRPRESIGTLWRDGRAAEGACLENMFGSHQRGFESHSLRWELQVCMLTGFQVAQRTCQHSNLKTFNPNLGRCQSGRMGPPAKRLRALNVLRGFESLPSRRVWLASAGHPDSGVHSSKRACSSGDRALGCGPKGRRFESCQAYHDSPPGLRRAVFTSGGLIWRSLVERHWYTSQVWRGVRVVEGAALEKR
jgi:hypothetical protein